MLWNWSLSYRISLHYKHFYRTNAVLYLIKLYITIILKHIAIYTLVWCKIFFMFFKDVYFVMAAFIWLKNIV